ncbi:MAG: site-specific integrase, partial [Nevskia sp.]|nr:site-specific integrase [Nevskia sp.]
IRAPRRDFHHLTPQQLADAINATENPRDRCLIATAITTGLRTSDLIDLRLSNINLDNATITLRIQKTDVETVKPIPIELDRELRRWLTHYEELKIHPQAAATPKHQWHLFPRFYTNPTDGTYIADPAHGLTTRSARNIAHKTLQKIGIQWHGECLHLFRRSAARVFFDQLAASGHDTALLATRAFLDHSSVAVTEKYIGLNTERQFVINSLARKPFLPQQQTAPAAEAAGAEERNIHETNDNTMRRLRLTRRR